MFNRKFYELNILNLIFLRKERKDALVTEEEDQEKKSSSKKKQKRKNKDSMINVFVVK